MIIDKMEQIGHKDNVVTEEANHQLIYLIIMITAMKKLIYNGF